MSKQPKHFNPRSSCEERPYKPDFPRIDDNFNPRSSCEERHFQRDIVRWALKFQSTLLMRGATQTYHQQSIPCQFQSTLLMRGATIAQAGVYERLEISIHAPHARSDRTNQTFHASMIISIHAPHARSDIFSATLCDGHSNFNPRSSCEERPGHINRIGVGTDFNPRSSCEERLVDFWHFLAVYNISIHAPHTRSDSNPSQIPFAWHYFNPRSSYEERRDTR